MARYGVHTSLQRFDSYKDYQFRVKWDRKYVAGVSKVSALKRTTGVVKRREGDDPSCVRKSPGQINYEPITLERGVTHDEEVLLGCPGLPLSQGEINISIKVPSIGVPRVRQAKPGEGGRDDVSPR